MSSEETYPTRQLPDGRTLFVQRMTYGKGRLYITNKDFPLTIDTEY